MNTFRDRITQAFNLEQERRIWEGSPKLTKTHLWKAAKLSSAAASHWFQGSNGADLHVCRLIAPLLRCDPDWLFDGTAPKSCNGQTTIEGSPRRPPQEAPPESIAQEIAAIAAKLSLKGQLELYAYAKGLADRYPSEVEVLL
jgi:hypothetical protein